MAELISEIKFLGVCVCVCVYWKSNITGEGDTIQ